MLLRLGAITAAALALLAGVKAKPVGADGKVLQAYYADWTTMDPSSIPFDQVTHVNYAFASLRQDHLPRFSINGTLSLTPGPKLKQLVTAAHAANTKVHLSVGGWAGSTNFSPMAADLTSGGKRDQFLQAVTGLVKTYDLDGVDIDWEHPGMPDTSQTCTITSSSDYENYVSLLKTLKTALGSNKIVTIAAHLGGIKQAIWNCRDLSSQWAVQECTMDGLAASLDWVNVMTYDFGGPWNTITESNAPLVSPGANSQAPFIYSLSDAITRWETLGVPKTQLVFGIPFYARSTSTTQTMAGLADTDQYVSQSQNNPPKGDSDDILDPDTCDGPAQNHYSGVWKWKNLRSQGVLTDPSKASAPWQQHWDSDTLTNWLWRPDTNVYLSYDDPRSLTAKINYLRCTDVLGAMVWEISQDNGELLPSLQGIFNPAPKANCSATDPGPTGLTTSSSGTASSPSSTRRITATSTSSSTANARVSSTTRTSSSTKAKPKTTKPKTTQPKTTQPVAKRSHKGSDSLPPCTAVDNDVYKCLASHKSPMYSLCLNGKWTGFSCVSETVCVQKGNSIGCFYPK